MAFILSLDDSELGGLAVDTGSSEVRLRLASAAVRTDDGRRGWLPGVRLSLPGAVLDGEARHAFGRIADGRLSVAGQAVATLALPGVLDGPVALALRLANGASLALRARSLVATVDDGAVFQDDLSC